MLFKGLFSSVDSEVEKEVSDREVNSLVWTGFDGILITMLYIYIYIYIYIERMYVNNSNCDS